MNYDKGLRIIISVFIWCATFLVIICASVNHIKINWIIIFLWGAITPFITNKIAGLINK